jgi:hypothetical protein
MVGEEAAIADDDAECHFLVHVKCGPIAILYNPGEMSSAYMVSTGKNGYDLDRYEERDLDSGGGCVVVSGFTAAVA